MKVSVYPRGANPRIDRHIQRKSLHFAHEQVEVYGAAEWVDSNDPTKGIICRDHLYLGEKVERILDATPEELKKLTHGKLRSALPPAEIGDCKFIPPFTEKNESLNRLQLETLAMAEQGWDWTREPAMA